MINEGGGRGDGGRGEDEATRREDGPVAPEPTEPPRAGQRRRRASSLLFVAFGLVVAAYLSRQGSQEQHVRIVLGAGAPEVTAVGLQYIAQDGEIAREAHFAYSPGAAPRVLPHEPRLPSGDYRIQIDIDARDGRRSVQRQVTLGGGSTQIDVSSMMAAKKSPD